MMSLIKAKKKVRKTALAKRDFPGVRFAAKSKSLPRNDANGPLSERACRPPIRAKDHELTLTAVPPLISIPSGIYGPIRGVRWKIL